MTSIFPVLYAILYGGIVALAYFFVRLKGDAGGLELFGAASAVIFLAHFILWPRKALGGIADKTMFVRGLLFAVTQVLLFKAQAHGYTSSALVASIMGSVFGLLLGRALLKEKIQGLALFGAVLCCALGLLTQSFCLNRILEF